MKKEWLSFEQLEAKTARERDTNLFKEDLEMILGQPLKDFKRKDCPGFFEEVEKTLKMLIADLALNLHWQFDEGSDSVTVKGYSFNCAFDLQSIGVIAERWGKEPKIIGYRKPKPENCTRHLKFGLWLKAIKDGLAKVEDGKVLKQVGFACELGKEDLPVYKEFASYLNVSNLVPVKDARDLFEWPKNQKLIVADSKNKFFRLVFFEVFGLQNENSGSYDVRGETEAFIQFYNQITKKTVKAVNPARQFVTVESPNLNKWRK